MSDEQLFLEATKEASSPERDEALWAKAMALAEGAEDKAKYLYIQMRVKQLAASRQASLFVGSRSCLIGATGCTLTLRSKEESLWIFQLTLLRQEDS